MAIYWVMSVLSSLSMPSIDMAHACYCASGSSYMLSASKQLLGHKSVISMSHKYIIDYQAWRFQRAV